MSYDSAFIVGCDRSGTTLLRALLDGHPSVAAPPESHFIPTILSTWPEGPVDPDAFVDILRQQPRFSLWQVTLPRARQLAAAAPDAIDALKALFQEQASTCRKKIWMDKTPGNALHVPRLAASFDSAIFVHLVRDGRDVALSLVAQEFGPTSIGGAALYWRKRVTAAAAAGRELPDGRYLEVRYEDLVDRPREVLQRILDLVGLDFDEQMLDVGRVAERIQRTTLRPEAHSRLPLGLRSGLRTWQAEMLPRDVEVFELLAGETLEEHGYETSGQRPSVGARVKAWRLSTRRRMWRGRGSRSPRPPDA